MNTNNLLKSCLESQEEIDAALTSFQDLQDDSSPLTESGKYYDELVAKGEENFKVMCGFYEHEFLNLYGIVQPALMEKKRNKNAQFTPVEEFLIALIFMKHAPKFDKFALDIGYKHSSSAQRLVFGTVERISPVLLDHFLSTMHKKEQEANNITFRRFPEAALVVDVTFQPCHKPKTLKFAEAQHNFSGKHKRYGLKVEIAHLPNGIPVFVSNAFAGSTHDFNIFGQSLEKYQKFLMKQHDETMMQDDGEGKTQHPNMWAILADKGYQGAAKQIRAILPKKGTRLTQHEKVRNKQLAADRIICENFYGRLKTKWGIMRITWPYDRERFETVFKLCVALTIYDLHLCPLRESDLTNYTGIMQNYVKVGVDKLNKQQAWHTKSLKRKAERTANAHAFIRRKLY